MVKLWAVCLMAMTGCGAGVPNSPARPAFSPSPVGTSVPSPVPSWGHHFSAYLPSYCHQPPRLPAPWVDPDIHERSSFPTTVTARSYRLICDSLLRDKRWPEPEAVHIEELVSAFRYEDPRPKGSEGFGLSCELSDCPWDPQSRLLRIAVGSRLPQPPRDLVVLLGVSDSTTGQHRQEAVHQRIAHLFPRLSEWNHAVVVCGESPETHPPLQRNNFNSKRFKRVIVIAESNPKCPWKSMAWVSSYRSSPPGATVPFTLVTVNQGVLSAPGRTDLAPMESAIEYNWGAAVPDRPLACRASIEVAFHSSNVMGYRLLCSRDGPLSPGEPRDVLREVHAGQQITALYQVRLKHRSMGGCLHVRQKETYGIADLKWTYYQGQEKSPHVLTRRLSLDEYRPLSRSSDDFRFTTAVAQFGLILTGTPGAGTFHQVESLAESSRGRDQDGSRSQFLQLVHRAQQLRHRPTPDGKNFFACPAIRRSQAFGSKRSVRGSGPGDTRKSSPQCGKSAQIRVIRHQISPKPLTRAWTPHKSGSCSPQSAQNRPPEGMSGG